MSHIEPQVLNLSLSTRPIFSIHMNWTVLVLPLLRLPISFLNSITPIFVHGLYLHQMAFVLITLPVCWGTLITQAHDSLWPQFHTVPSIICPNLAQSSQIFRRNKDERLIFKTLFYFVPLKILNSLIPSNRMFLLLFLFSSGLFQIRFHSSHHRP